MGGLWRGAAVPDLVNHRRGLRGGRFMIILVVGFLGVPVVVGAPPYFWRTRRDRRRRRLEGRMTLCSHVIVWGIGIWVSLLRALVFGPGDIETSHNLLGVRVVGERSVEVDPGPSVLSIGPGRVLDRAAE